MAAVLQSPTATSHRLVGWPSFFFAALLLVTIPSSTSSLPAQRCHLCALIFEKHPSYLSLSSLAPDSYTGASCACDSSSEIPCPTSTIFTSDAQSCLHIASQTSPHRPTTRRSHRAADFASGFRCRQKNEKTITSVSTSYEPIRYVRIAYRRATTFEISR
jgi:hypothetical protein